MSKSKSSKASKPTTQRATIDPKAQRATGNGDPESSAPSDNEGDNPPEQVVTFDDNNASTAFAFAKRRSNKEVYKVIKHLPRDLKTALRNTGLATGSVRARDASTDNEGGCDSWEHTTAVVITTYRLYDRVSFSNITKFEKVLLDPKYHTTGPSGISPSAIPYLLALGEWFAHNKFPPKDYEEVGDDKRRRNPSKSAPQVKPLELPTFSGEFFDWSAWKEGAEIYFQAAGLHDVLMDRGYSNTHGRENKMVFATLLNALSNTGVAFNCWDDLGTEVTGTGDGHGAWSRLVAYFERPQLLKFLLDEQKMQLEALVLDKDTSLKEFMDGFREAMRRIKTYESTLVKCKPSFPVQKTVDWKEKFLSKIMDHRYRTTKELCMEKKDTIDLQEIFISFNVTGLDYINMSGGKDKGGKKQPAKTATGGKDKATGKKPGGHRSDNSSVGESAGKEKQQQDKTPVQAVSDLKSKLFRAAGDDETKKSLLKELLASTQEPKDAGKKKGSNNSNRYKKRKRDTADTTESRRRPGGKQQTTKTDEVSVDSEIAELFG